MNKGKRFNWTLKNEIENKIYYKNKNDSIFTNGVWLKIYKNVWVKINRGTSSNIITLLKK